MVGGYRISTLNLKYGNNPKTRVSKRGDYSQSGDRYITQQVTYISMSALDNLLAESLSSMIKQKLGNKTFQKIEKRLNERYGITVYEAIRDFQKLDATLREFFGPGADEMERDFLGNFLSIDKSRKEKPLIVIENQKLATLILESFGDPDKKTILDSSLREPNVIMDILDICRIPKSSGYRVVGELIKDGLLTEKGFATTRDGKKVSRYVTLFENVKIEIQGQKVIAKVQINEDFLRESYLMKIMQEA